MNRIKNVAQDAIDRSESTARPVDLHSSNMQEYNELYDALSWASDEETEYDDYTEFSGDTGWCVRLHD